MKIENVLKVKKINLILITGFVWTGVSFLLTKRAIGWFGEFSQTEILISVIGTLILAFVKTYFIFIKVTNKNIERIMHMKREKIYFFEMHAVKLYILITLMIATGVVLRNLDFIPKFSIFPIYAGVGIAMIYASIMYYMTFFKLKKVLLK